MTLALIQGWHTRQLEFVLAVEHTKENQGIRFRIGDKEKEKNRHR